MKADGTTAPTEDYPRFRHAADQAVILEFGDRIDPVINMQVIGLDRALAAAPVVGVLETVPTYRSLCIRYDPLVIRSADLIAELRLRLSGRSEHQGGRRLWAVPVLYGGEAGPDLDDIARMHDLTSKEVIALHSSARYRVYMIGFMPGYAYLGGLPEALHTSRLDRPRPSMPSGSIAIGGAQTSIFSVACPSGWRVLGQTPLRMFDRARTPAILMAAGDEVCFDPISVAEAARLARAAEPGNLPAVCDVLE